ncbi:hypothetical protein Q7C36_023209 [Tachysurus vachellii]|uniref:C-type lectin domain-containing protein n=1 Tax=Tachysurus vachellii TaxID=175792 RepID=A0AA88IHM3_TACVA|nr:hypothetical protein Q7C36_023209 [Tachysurus vachellii]
MPKIIVPQQKMNWEDALNYCRTYYKDLVSLSTDDDLRAVKAANQTYQSPSLWTGLRFINGLWFWVNNKTLGNLISVSSCPTRPFQCGALKTEDSLILSWAQPHPNSHGHRITQTLMSTDSPKLSWAQTQPNSHGYRITQTLMSTDSPKLPWAQTHPNSHGHRLTQTLMGTDSPKLSWAQTHPNSHGHRLTQTPMGTDSPKLPWAQTQSNSHDHRLTLYRLGEQDSISRCTAQCCCCEHGVYYLHVDPLRFSHSAVCRVYTEFCKTHKHSTVNSSLTP